MTRHAALLLIPFLVFAFGCSGDDDPTPAASGGASGSGGLGGTGTGGTNLGGSPNTGGAPNTGGTAGGDAGLVDPTSGVAPAELVQDGFMFLEGPAWEKSSNTLYFTDIPANTIYALSGAGPATVFRNPSGNANGLGFDTQGRLLACEHSGRRVSRSTGGGAAETIVDEYENEALHSPNDIAIRSDGTLYFTDPPYGGNPRELSFNGVFRVDPSGTMHLVADDLVRPNGIVLAPDESVLYVADTQQAFVRRYDVAQDGTTSNPSKFTDTSNGPDGMAVDEQGYLYVTAQAGVEVYRPDGTLHDTLPVPQQPANCAFGGSDGKTLFVTARTGLYRFGLNVPGHFLP